jgi:hypothetical protein
MRFLRTITSTAAALTVALAATGCTGADTTTAPATASNAAVTASSSATAVSPTQSPTASSTSPATTQATSSSPSGTRSAQAQGTKAASAGTALAALEALDVKGRAPKTGYDRDQFGPAWTDTDRNGCDTRNDILARDLTGQTFKPGTRDCVVATGVLDDPYTATWIHFVRGQNTSTAVQVDHVVALSDAWQKGAQQLSASQRTAFANDPLNLLAVDGPTNAQKGDGDAATWLPSNKSFRCDYVARQIAVKATYKLWVTAAEKGAMTRVLASCPDQVLPGAGTAARAYEITPRSTQSAKPAPAKTTQAPKPHAPKTQAPAPAPKAQAPAPTTQAPQQGRTDPDFGTCKAAKAAGYGPYVRGVDPEYGWYRDGDSDGTVCE